MATSKRVTPGREGYKILFNENTVIMNHKFAAAAAKYGTKENKLMKNIRKDFPGMAEVIVSGRECDKAKPNSRLTYDNMKKHIAAYDRGIEELLERVSSWNYEFLQDSEVVGPHREQIIMDMKKIARLIDRVDLQRGMAMGVPTVKELIAILSKLPEDYRVYCCGGENYLYIWEKSKSITIDHEYSLA